MNQSYRMRVYSHAHSFFQSFYDRTGLINKSATLAASILLTGYLEPRFNL
jgi:hypothetical protein